MSARRRSGSGFTLLEVIIASAVLGALILAVFAVLSSGTDHSASMTAGVQADTAARDFLQKFSEEFQASGSTVTTEAPLVSTERLYKPNTFNTVKFAVTTGYTVGSTLSMQYDHRAEYSWELSSAENDPKIVGETRGVDGEDSDNNGLVDDGQIRRRLVEIASGKVLEEGVVLRNVTRRGFAVEYVTGPSTLNDITVNLEVFFIDPKRKQKDADSGTWLQGHATRLVTQRVTRRKV